LAAEILYNASPLRDLKGQAVLLPGVSSTGWAAGVYADDALVLYVVCEPAAWPWLRAWDRTAAGRR
jgi:hypothetical protein